jgi:hypothetical protein
MNENIKTKTIGTFSSDKMIGEIYKVENKENIYLLKANYVGTLPIIIYFLAANPSNCFYGTIANQYLVPFPNETIAFENSPNNDFITLYDNRNFEIYFSMPNPYFNSNGNIYHSSRLYFKFVRFKQSKNGNEKIIINTIENSPNIILELKFIK